MKKGKTVVIPNDLDLELAKYQIRQAEKTGKKPTLMEVVENAIRKLLQSENK
jgi:hypothetical protein